MKKRSGDSADSVKRSLKGSFVLLLAGSAALVLSRNTDWFGEWYAEHIFPVFPDAIGRVMSLFPFSVFEILIYALTAFFAAYVIYLLFLAVVPGRRKKLKRAAISALCFTLVFASAAFMALSLTCLVNYSRETFAGLTGRETAPASKEDLLNLCELLIRDVNELSGKITADKEGLFSLGDTDVKMEARDSMTRLGRQEKALSGYYPNPKPLIASRGMSWLGLTGIYSPFTIEANYNDDIPDYLIPFTVCHELAHLRGFIREDEAGFISYLACRGSSLAGFRYSGAMNALSYALGAYYSDASPEEFADLCATIGEQPMRDFAANNAYWKRFEGKVSEIANKANDSYLKANAQEGGVKSYGRMVDLLLAEYKNAHV